MLDMMSSPWPVTIAGLVAALSALLFWRTRHPSQHSRSPPLPPGPFRIPLIGNILDIPRKSPWLGYQELSRRYGMLNLFTLQLELIECYIPGNIVYLNVLGRSILVLSDPVDAFELLEKRSAIYSSRLQMNLVRL